MQSLLACSNPPDIVRPAQLDAADDSKVMIYVVSHGWHTGLILPAAQLKAALPGLALRFSDAEYLELGWGDKGFYQADEITLALSLQAIFWPGESVMHVVEIPQPVSRYFKNSPLQKLCLRTSQYQALVQFIKNSFQLNTRNEIQPLQTGIYGNSQFYKGTGHYHLMNTCNKWTAKALRSAGLDIAPMFKLSADSVMDDLRNSAASSAGADDSCHIKEPETHALL